MARYIVIPARYASTRLPGKPLKMIGDKTLVQHTYDKASLCGFDEVFVATDDNRIAECAQDFGAKVVMTLPDHKTGTDRLAEVVEIMGFEDDDIVVNTQGDEPMLPVVDIVQVADNLDLDETSAIATLCEPITDRSDLFNEHCVKVVMNHQGHALYFSRAPIPWMRGVYASPLAEDNKSHSKELDQSSPIGYRHIGLYAYRAHFLRAYPSLKPSELEEAEALEQLRAMSAGYQIHVAVAQEQTVPGIDTEEDLQRARKRLGY